MTFKEYILLNEDAASQERAAINILKKAKYDDTFIQKVINTLKYITEPYSNHRGAKNNGHLPDLAKLYISSKYKIDLLKHEYDKYMSLPKINTKPLSRFNGDFLKFAGEVHAANTVQGIYTGKNINNKDAVYEDENVVVFLADTPEKAIIYGKGEKYTLCISRPLEGQPGYNPHERNMFWDYRPEMSTYFVYFKKVDPTRHPACGFMIVDALKGDNVSFSINLVTDLKGATINDDYRIGQYQLSTEFPELEEPIKNGIFEFIPLSFAENIGRYKEDSGDILIFLQIVENEYNNDTHKLYQLSEKDKTLLSDAIEHMIDSTDATLLNINNLFASEFNNTPYSHLSKLFIEEGFLTEKIKAKLFAKLAEPIRPTTEFNEKYYDTWYDYDEKYQEIIKQAVENDFIQTLHKIKGSASGFNDEFGLELVERVDWKTNRQTITQLGKLLQEILQKDKAYEYLLLHTIRDTISIYGNSISYYPLSLKVLFQFAKLLYKYPSQEKTDEWYDIFNYILDSKHPGSIIKTFVRTVGWEYLPEWLVDDPVVYDSSIWRPLLEYLYAVYVRDSNNMSPELKLAKPKIIAKMIKVYHDNGMEGYLGGYHEGKFIQELKDLRDKQVKESYTPSNFSNFFKSHFTK